MTDQPCKGRLCMDGIGVDCIITCRSEKQLDRALKTPVTTATAGVSRVISARFSSRCRQCSGSIREGDDIVLLDGGGAAHAECP